jgi:hypothetical protein
VTSAEHLNNHHRNTLRQILQHPTSHNIEWRSVVSLLETVGTVDRRHDGKLAVTVGSQTQVFDHFETKDIDARTVSELRGMLSKAGYGTGTPPGHEV